MLGKPTEAGAKEGLPPAGWALGRFSDAAVGGVNWGGGEG